MRAERVALCLQCSREWQEEEEEQHSFGRCESCAHQHTKHIFPCTAVAGDMAESPASETRGLFISNRAEFTFRKAGKETKGKKCDGAGQAGSKLQ